MDKKFPQPIIIIHGGAGSRKKPAKGEIVFLEELARQAVIEFQSAQALDIVQQIVSRLEESGLYNAGRSAVKQSDGKRRLDASLMDGETGKFGAAAGMTCTTRAVDVARKVMGETPHLLLAGNGADNFAKKYKFPKAKWNVTEIIKSSHGTVGGVARDIYGNLAAATSTGGLSGALAGRVGDSAILGAGTYADKFCAVSCTGRGEDFMRTLLAGHAALLVRKGKTALQAANLAIKFLTRHSGSGGLIIVDKLGNTGVAHNTKYMLYSR